MNKTLILLLLAGTAAADDAAVLRIASDATFQPFHWVDDAGRVTGFDIELARAVAREAGMEPNVIVLDYGALFADLGDTHDVVAATTGITTERREKYLFSAPYFETCQVAVVRAGADEPRSLAELAGRRIGAAGAGTSAAAMRTIDGTHVRLEDGGGVAALEEGLIDAWIVDEFDGVAAAREGGFAVVPQPVALERYGFVLARDRDDLRRRLDDALAALDKAGEIRELRVRFGLDRGAGWPVDW